MKQKILFIAVWVVVISLTQSVRAQNGSVVSPSGQTLYYRLWNVVDENQTVVSTSALITAPNINVTYEELSYYIEMGYYPCYWNESDPPSGNLIIPDSVTHNGTKYPVTFILAAAFSGCTNLTSVVIPNTIMYIDKCSFAGCSSLTSVNLPNSILQIGDGAFAECNSLTSVNFPNSITFVGSNIFKGCNNLTTPVYNDHLFVFLPYSYSGSYSVPEGITTVCSGAIRNCPGLTSLTLPVSFDSMPDILFTDCSNMTSVTLNSVPPASHCYGMHWTGNENVTLNVPCGGAYKCGFDRYWSSFGDILGYGQGGISVDTTFCFGSEYYHYYYGYQGENYYSYYWFFQVIPEYHIIPESGKYSFVYLYGCEGDTLTLNISTAQAPHICMVSVRDNHNEVIWNNVDPEAEEYYIYRESDVAGEYVKVATVSVEEPSRWLDTASRPTTRSYRYKLSLKSSCVDETELSAEHKTAHLTINRGQNNTWNLLWTEYEGTDFVTCIIYRGSNQYELEEIDRLSVGGNTSYSDDTAPEGDVFYQVGLVPASPCTPTQTKETADVILTNIATNGVLGVENIGLDGIKVYAQEGRIVVEGTSDEVKVYDIKGCQVDNKGLSAGVYMVKVGAMPAKKVLVVK